MLTQLSTFGTRPQYPMDIQGWFLQYTVETTNVDTSWARKMLRCAYLRGDIAFRTVKQNKVSRLYRLS